MLVKWILPLIPACPAVSIRSHVQSDDLSHCTEHTVLPSEGMIASVRCLVVLVLRWLFVGYLLVWLNRNSWMNRRCSGRQPMRMVTHGLPQRSMKYSTPVVGAADLHVYSETLTQDITRLLTNSYVRTRCRQLLR